MEIKIDKGVPMPKKHLLSGIADAMRKMEIGDSFVVPLDARSNMKGYAVRIGITITTRKISGTEVRVWRKT